MDVTAYELRKNSHLREALRFKNQAQGLSGLEAVHLFHDALPELDFSQISISLGNFKTPFFIAGMTAGHPQALDINGQLAEACCERGWILGIGSQRRDIMSLSSPNPDPFLRSWAQFRGRFPDLAILSNIGLSQLGTISKSNLTEFLKVLNPWAFVVHTNALQEVLQPEGTPQFRNGIQALLELTQSLSIPVVLKETGCGFSENTLRKLLRPEEGEASVALPLYAVDVSGLGGTHWGRIEGSRNSDSSMLSLASESFSNWGETTVDSVLAVKKILPDMEIWGSGGVRSGLDAAKLIALGAKRIGFAQPALTAVMEGKAKLLRWMELMEFELKLALFCTGSVSPEALRTKESAWKLKQV